MAYKEYPPKLYVVEHDEGVYLYDSTQVTTACSGTGCYWLIWLYWRNDDLSDDNYFEPGDCKYVPYTNVDSIPEGNCLKALVTEAKEDWYKFDDDEDENTESVYRKYMDEWEEYCKCNHQI